MRAGNLAKHKCGFTLLEIMIVTVIVGMLAVLALPAISNAKMNSQNSRLLNDFRAFSGALETFALESGDYPEDSSSGAIPAGLEEYIQTDKWIGGAPIGGVWDVEKEQFDVTSAIGVHRYTVSEKQLNRFDLRYDDGDRSTGKYRNLASDRFYHVVDE